MFKHLVMGDVDLTPHGQQLVWRLCVIWFFMIMAWAMLQAAVPLMLKDMLGRSEAASWQGILTAVTASSGLVFCSMLGYFSDRIGRMAIFAPWCLAFTVGTLLVIATDQTQVIFPVFLARLPALAIPMTLLFALTSDFASGKTLLKVHGLIGASFGVALMLGSGLSALIGKYASRSYVFYSAFFSASIGTFAAFTVPATLVTTVIDDYAFERMMRHEDSANSPRLPGTTSPSPASPSSVMRSSPASYIAALKVIRGDPLLLCNVLAFGVVRTANVNSFFMFVLYTNWRLKWGIVDTSMALGFVGALAVLWQSFGVKYVVERLQEDKVVSILIALLVAYPLLMIGYGAVTTTPAMYAVAVIGSVTSIAPAIFTQKITTLSTQDGIAGSSLGVVGSVTCLLELPCAYVFSQLLGMTMTIYLPSMTAAGLPYFCNALVYLLALGLILVGDMCYGKTRVGWRVHPTGPGDETKAEV